MAKSLGLGERPRKGMPNLALKRFREAAKLTQAQLAELAHMSQAAIARLESGETRTNADYAAKLGPLLGRAPRDLFPEAESNHADARMPHTDRDGMRRAIRIGRRYAGDDERLLVELTSLAYALLMREQAGYPISDDEETLALFDEFVRRMRGAGE